MIQNHIHIHLDLLKRSLFAFLFAGVLLFSLPAYGQFAGGDGSKSNPHEISDWHDFDNIRNDLTANYILANDLDEQTSGYDDIAGPTANGGNGFDPFGVFSGSLDGGEHTVSGLTIVRPNMSEAALFKQTKASASISNIQFVNVHIKGGTKTAALAGRMVGEMQNVSVQGSIEGTNQTGGLAGVLAGDASNASFIGTVTGTTQVGGLAGILEHKNISESQADAVVHGSGERVGGLVGWNNQGTIASSSTSGKVTGGNQIGGLVGRNGNGTIRDSHSASDVEGHDETGGLVGNNHAGSNDAIIKRSYSTGKVEGNKNVGGLVGYSASGSAVIKKCFSLSDVSGVNNQVGGLVGRLDQGLVENSFARGDVSGNNRVGGLVGQMRWSGVAIKNTFATGKAVSTTNADQVGGLIGFNQQGSSSNSFWDIETSETEVGYGETTGSSMAGVTGKTTDEMKTQATFTDTGTTGLDEAWNFNTIWTMDPQGIINNGYPYLQTIDFPVVFNIYYSRESGDWHNNNTWSTDETLKHDGPAAQSAPRPNDEVQIGAGENGGHVVYLSKNVTLAQGQVRVKDEGTLNSGTYWLKPGGTFRLEAGGTLITADKDGITSSADKGSIQTNTRHFDEVANYTYNGSVAQVTGNGLPDNVNNLRIDNPEGVSREGSLTVNGQLKLDNGTFTMSSGASLVTYDVAEGNGNIRMQLTIEGDSENEDDKGWRMVSTPVTDISFSEFFEGFVTQGFEGAAYCATKENYPLLQPNVLWFDETEIGTTNMGWRAPDHANEKLVSGKGYFHYVFDGAGLPTTHYPGESYDDRLPITMMATGKEPAFEDDNGVERFFYPISFKSRDTYDPDPDDDEPFFDINMEDAGWNLIGNPTTASLDWGNNDEWIRENIDETFYVWVAEAGSEGSYQAWNSIIADVGDFTPLPDGLIAPFQGFWVLANDENPTLAFSHDAKTTGGNFHQKNQQSKSDPAFNDPIVLSMQLKADGMTTKAYVAFSESGKKGRDPYDGYRLEPLSQSYLELYTTNLVTFSPLVINNLPEKLEDDLRIPLYVGGLRNGNPIQGKYSLHWRLPPNWHADWGITLMDHQEEKAIPLTHQQEYHFSHQSTTPAKKTTEAGFAHPEHVVKPIDVPTKAKNKGSNRFTLVASPGKPNEVPVYTPDTPALLPPYPNPTNAMTTVQFFIPEKQYVHIRVFDLHGRHVTTLAHRKFESGHHALPTYSMDHLHHGVYVISLQTLHHKDSEKITLIR